jgi:hypothetical protein
MPPDSQRFQRGLSAPPQVVQMQLNRALAASPARKNAHFQRAFVSSFSRGYQLRDDLLQQLES